MKKIIPLLFAVLLAGCQLIPSTKPTASFKLTDPQITIITPSPTIIITPTTMSTPSAEITQVTAIMKTSQGDITIELFPKSAPKTVANFIGLSKGTLDWTDPKSGQKVSGKSLYNGTIFHRVIKDFMIQGGDPLGTGTGGPGYKFEDEFDSSLNFSEPYMLAMANSGPATNGSQFFITVVPTTWLNNKHTIFGKVTKGQEIVDAIVSAPTSAGDKPITEIKIVGIDIVEK
ncbi:MAG: Peptidyl-prolyl cis-trans isomerase [Candidatus Collierbacteria bacterium GW2011_GWB1_45_35]|uniref:Peptidyl-prolyl cis-trans isomerase n=2 Tax=Candidatus Collieribacteriota TaxID=1752725 RepID=A0A0G1KRU4_9BACT|nr:MAG: Peptidyl-prolyl cis-trans isomerase [Microgenomates group bacterium GW2011_GWC1_44_23]KKT86366.1 MAG: Peptidyl-prolyl cis-trans isomerase [Candidatus Collierbacteria bacterium GW2011_GWA2_44_99]KKT95773.1 MAG: Peptidyl-prolyl cis-trans isomerase [Candidatus Collierbacteria bacterium GW2011_GWA1_45_15]KKU00283.1 MAG: Peptidyl-prolyl cis-trans isomerase [Candidatus Collierbacteria bacterium GW2011_GWB2_45_17]KKU05490.1 MAG: Peptidyl-prolyl cis-trans isomerase [Candidatus Collierbacteria b